MFFLTSLFPAPLHCSSPMGQASLLSRFTPSPRYHHFSASCRGKVVIWGGMIEDFMKNRERLGSVIETFDPFLERWEQQPTIGVPPPGLYRGACASIQDSLYTYGGWDGSSIQSGLHCLSGTSAMEWRKLEERIPQDGPMRKGGCRMVQFNDGILVLFGGYGFPRAAIQPGSSFIKNERSSEGRGWTNECHLFDVKQGMCMCSVHNTKDLYNNYIRIITVPILVVTYCS